MRKLLRGRMDEDVTGEMLRALASVYSIDEQIFPTQHRDSAKGNEHDSGDKNDD